MLFVSLYEQYEAYGIEIWIVASVLVLDIATKVWM